MRIVVNRWIAIALLGIVVECTVARVDFGSVIKGDEPELLVDTCGKGDPAVVSNGYLFVDYRYIPAPYTIQRVGQAVVVNGVVVNCLYTGNIMTNRPSVQIGSDGKPFWQMREKNMSTDLVSAASVNIDSLMRKLRYNAIILSKSGSLSKHCYTGNTVADTGLMMRLPRVGEFNLDEFSKALVLVFSEPSDAKALEIVKTEIGAVLNDKELLSLIRNARESHALKEHVRVEMDAKKQRPTTQQTNMPSAAGSQVSTTNFNK